MSAEDVFNVRRNAYWWAWQYELKLGWHGDGDGSAVWCASKYVAHLVEKILRRKAKVDLATTKQRNIQAPAKKNPPPLPPHLQEEGRSRPRVPEILVHLTNAVTGEGVWVVKMSRWAVLGDAIAKANMQLDETRRTFRGAQEDGTPGDENDRWYLAAQNERSVRCRIQDVLQPDQERIDIPVVKLPKMPISNEG